MIFEDHTNAANMGFSPKRSRNRQVLLVLYALAHAIAMLILSGASRDKLYSPSPFHRLEADALLQGKLNIGDSIYQLDHGLAWHDGQVNHVWGLGVGLWLAPFEALWRLCGQKWFPDRIALGVAFGLLTWYCASTAWRLADATKRPALGISFVWLITLCPTMWTLTQSGRFIYEETSLYASIVSLGILIAVVRVACLREQKDFYICAVLAAMSALVRPTHGIYGLAGMLVCSLILIARGIRWRPLLLGNAILLAGLIFLAATNSSRFGSPTEFGHRLTVTSGLIVYYTRMGNPMEQATRWEAAKELFGMLFLLGDANPGRPIKGPGIPWQTQYPRWRETSLAAFHPSWAAVCLVGGLGGTVAVAKRFRGRSGRITLATKRRRRAALLLGMSLWSFIGAAALVAFYLRFACFSTRYLLDFGPAFTGFAVVVWLLQPRRWPWLWPIILVGWLGPQLLTAQLPLLDGNAAQSELPSHKAQGLETFGGDYDSPEQPEQTGIPYNGSGWASGDEGADNIVTLALDRPEFVELLVGQRQNVSGIAPRPDSYRAMIGGNFLTIRELKNEGDRVRVRFAISDKIRRHAGDELLFLCFSDGYDQEDQTSKRMLYSVRWR